MKWLFASLAILPLVGCANQNETAANLAKLSGYVVNHESRIEIQESKWDKKTGKLKPEFSSDQPTVPPTPLSPANCPTSGELEKKFDEAVKVLGAPEIVREEAVRMNKKADDMQKMRDKFFKPYQPPCSSSTSCEEAFLVNVVEKQPCYSQRIKGMPHIWNKWPCRHDPVEGIIWYAFCPDKPDKKIWYVLFLPR